MGLLQQASLLSNFKGLAFYDITKKHNLKNAAIYTKSNSFYFISNSYGFDGETILKSYSTSDFWNGIIKQNNSVTTFNKQDLSPLYQLFSYEMQDKIEYISALKTENDIFILLNREITEELQKDIAILNKSLTPFNKDNSLSNKALKLRFCLDVNYAVQDYITKYLSDPFIKTETVKAALLNEIENRLCSYFSTNQFLIKKENNLYKIAAPAEYKISESLIYKHLMLNLQDLLKEASKQLKISPEL